MNNVDVVVIGLGVTGVPMALAAADAGMAVVGVDADPARVRELGARLSARRVRVRLAGAAAPAARAHLLCVPTPPGGDDGADLAPLARAARAVGRGLRRGGLVVVQSTCPPGTVEGPVARGLADASGLTPGVDFHLAHAPDRIDPGNQSVPATRIPRVVGGLTPRCTRVAAEFLCQLVERVVPVSTCRTAEFVKTFENTFRLVNISLVNELADLCRSCDVEVAEVLDAAATKPFGFLPHRPGIGAGGVCIPVVPGFLSAWARRRGVRTEVVDAALAVNAVMPGRVVARLRGALNSRGIPLRNGRILVIGVSYKPDVAEARQSAAVRVLVSLRTEATVCYHDPFVPELRLPDGAVLRSVPLSDVAGVDVAVVLTRHTQVAPLVRSLPVPVLDIADGEANWVTGTCGPHVPPSRSCRRSLRRSRGGRPSSRPPQRRRVTSTRRGTLRGEEGH
ncbi:nucleotide sugar dehydrogenase [Streptoalloteichus hindustanus]|uniref:UDP-N-acetyl-D-glucosamine dehydrogenase n=1 Tax=Streptoalloteichus hindustanus TaxID=2017 RepID=A0A1M4YD06_STRHI|nr:nucleotide sugar dehydrogenase [Streptoalloteichus hindustanus]SHF03620.1 UDP-N-acetyl-D-glucosamine dehydrogenase [Streptoalloteichus hindustanus]